METSATFGYNHVIETLSSAHIHTLINTDPPKSVYIYVLGSLEKIVQV